MDLDDCQLRGRHDSRHFSRKRQQSRSQAAECALGENTTKARSAERLYLARRLASSSCEPTGETQSGPRWFLQHSRESAVSNCFSFCRWSMRGSSLYRLSLTPRSEEHTSE